MGFDIDLPNPLDALGDARDAVVDGVTDAGEYVAGKVDEAVDQTVAAGEYLADKAADAGEYVADKAVEAGEYIADKTVEAGEYLADKAVDAGEYIADKATDAGEYIADKATEAGEYLADKAADTWDAIRDPYDEIKEAVTPGPSTPSYQKQPDLSAPNPGGASDSFKVSPEDLRAISGAAGTVAEELRPTAGTMREAGTAPGLPGWEVAGALTGCTETWGTQLDKVTAEVRRISDTLAANSSGYAQQDIRIAEEFGG
ncbi:WXG100 family type VII secretion target [Yinghuangia soli]|uniref:Excreted virulence factor EspC (Type VII ESX diderm) n=1 Tax=Yinghuangia soli TaxID=2908204 RepID=A0AA41U0M6_9ACTN|nr:hypothetical protein [Yinghuangia soli]MCF2528615.1 hypothetical protein [Yinghuangia soli]